MTLHPKRQHFRCALNHHCHALHAVPCEYKEACCLHKVKKRKKRNEMKRKEKKRKEKKRKEKTRKDYAFWRQFNMRMRSHVLYQAAQVT